MVMERSCVMAREIDINTQYNTYTGPVGLYNVYLISVAVIQVRPRGILHIFL
jgi:hypothetical protein